MIRCRSNGLPALAAAALLVLAPGRGARASGLETSGIGARGRSLGYALTAVADDWTAVYYNPAGLAWAPGGEAAALYEYFTGGLSSSASLRNLPLGEAPDPSRGDFVDPVGDEPRAFGRRDVEGKAHAAELGWSLRRGRLGFGAGIYGSGAGSSWEDRAATADGGRIRADFSFRNVSVNLPVGIGAELLPRLAAGLAVTARYGLLDAEIEKARAGGRLAYAQRFRQETSGTGVSLDLGALWRVREGLALGAVWRLPYRMAKRGDTEVEQSLAGLALASGTRVVEEIPSRISLGASWRPGAADLLALSATWMDWSAYRRETTYDDPLPGVLEGGRGNPAEWEDTLILGAGWEHRFDPGWAGRLGVVRDQAPEPRSRRTLVGGQVVDAWRLTAGAGWRGRRAAVDLGYVRSWSRGEPGYLPAAEYRLSLHEIFVGATWRF